jgi:hypothetical protein
MLSENERGEMPLFPLAQARSGRAFSFIGGIRPFQKSADSKNADYILL